MTKHKRIAYIPQDAKFNPYVKNMHKILRTLGELDTKPTTAKIIFRVKYYDFFIINWVENSIITKCGKISFIKYIKLLLKILIWKMSTNNLINIEHNVYPHNLIASQRKLYSRLNKINKFIYDINISHINFQKNCILPHPLYTINTSGTESDEVHDYFLTFGRIEPYKNLEDLISIFNTTGKNLKIFGMCADSGYFERLISSKKENITLVNEFLPEEKLSRLVNSCKAVIIPSNSGSMILSGTLMYALSFNKEVIVRSNEFNLSFLERFPELPIHLFETNSQLLDIVSKFTTNKKNYSFEEFRTTHSDENITTTLLTIVGNKS
ncbi:hypothetical protein OAP82_01275 [Paracoccaceae bacterium]|nr:hypothetical protein [Paracoccaceae bacterium]MDC0867645.1 hypothetical protein [Paracoccaceae bacterium]